MSFTSGGVKLNTHPQKNAGWFFVRAAEVLLSILFVVALAGAPLLPKGSEAAIGVSNILSYQGRLTDSSGNPLGGSGTNYCFRFSLYDDATVGAPDTKLWPAGTPSTMTISVANGIFNTGIGDTGAGGDSLAAYNFYDNNATYLNVEVAAQVSGSCTGVTFETLGPRQRLDATAYASVARDVYGNLLRTDNANNRTQIGAGSGAITPILFGLDVKNIANSTLSYVGQTCTVNGTLWYNSATSKALLCENGVIRALANATTTVDALGISGNTAGTPSTISSGTITLAGGNNITLSQNGNAVTISGGDAAVHNSAYHSGTIFPGTDQALGDAFLQWGKRSATPSNPPANNINMYVTAIGGRPVLKILGETGVEYEVAGDTKTVARNISGSTITKGSLVYIISSSTSIPRVGLARANSETTMPVFGIALEDISNNSNGLILNTGIIYGINTSGFTEGDLLWLSPSVAGAFTTTKPSVPPNFPQRIGVVLNAHATQGSIFIFPVGMRGNFEGTNENLFNIGNAGAGAKSIGFNNANSAHLAWNPSANRTVHLPDASGTVGLLQQLTISGNTAGALAAISSGTMTLAGGNNITLSQNGNAVTISAGAGGVAGSNTFGMSNLGNTSGTSGTINGSAAQLLFAGGNNITLSQSINGSSATITISAFTQTVQTQNRFNMTLAGNSTSAGAGYIQISSGTLTLAGGNNITLSQNGNAVTIVGAAGGGGGVAVGAGTQTATSGTVIFSNANGVSFGLNNQTLTASVNAGGGNVPMRWTQIPAFRFSLSNLTNITAISMVPFFQPFRIDGVLTLSRLNWEMSRSTSGSNSFQISAGIYSYVNDTQISLVGSAYGDFSNSATASVSGIRRFGMSGFDVSTFAPGGYVLGLMFNPTGGTASMNYSIRGHSGAVQLGAINEGTNNYNTATSYNIFPFLGRYSTTLAAFPTTVAESAIRGQFSGASAPINAWIGFNND